MHISQMPNCCGIYLISNFGHTPVNGADRYNSYRPSVKEVYEYLENSKKGGSGKMLVAFVNEDQRRALKSAFAKAGFKRSNSFYHISHDRNIFQYTYINKNIKIKTK